MKKLINHIAGGVVLAGVAATAQAEISGNVALTTDYVFRGISQTGEDPAVQGGFDYAHDSGFYLGTWASSLEFGEDSSVVDPASMELDVYAGYSGNFTDALSYDVSVVHYMYPGASSSLNYDFTEVGAALGYDFGVAAITVGVAYSPDYFASSDTATYYYADLAVPLPSDFSVNFHVGQQNIDDNAAFGTPDYADYKVGVSKDIAGFGLALDWVDTDLSQSECFGGSDLCDSRVVFTVSKEL